MSIELEKTLPNGAVGNFWKITRCNFDAISLELACTLMLYTSKECELANPVEPLTGTGAALFFTQTITKAQKTGDLLKLCYEQINATDAFKDGKLT